ncbi:hypothetical protein PROFUN_13668 [Planoprotostelium fungivorum]|uniref:Transmembrane protein n=1 Tax=Planoprotostelium fungivorum TaxID=1890364 RepID=A0A2P6MN35_9EUKA|nr:hypothetical protein PROFUN_13668 [Planoprotostelium fungivorum]
MLTLSLQFAATIFLCFMYVRLSPYVSVSHQFFTGLYFCLPPMQDDEIEDKSNRNRKIKKKEESDDRGTVKMSQIEDNRLFKHLFWDNFDHLVLIFIVLLFNFFITEFWSCIIEDQSSLNTALLLFAMFYSLTVMTALVGHSGPQGITTRMFAGVTVGSTILAFGVLDVLEGYTTFGGDLRQGFHDFQQNLSQYSTENFDASIDITYSTFRLIIAIFSGLLGGVLFFSVLRYVRSYHEINSYRPDDWPTKLSHFCFVIPFIVVWFWIEPFRKVMVERITYYFPSFRDETLTVMQFYFIFIFCFCQFLLIRAYLEAFLATGTVWSEVKSPPKSVGWTRMAVRFKIVSLYTGVVTVACQFLAPAVLILSFLFFWKLRGIAHISTLPYCVPSVSPEEGMRLFSVTFYRGLFSFFVWWTMALWSLFSGAAYYFERDNNVFSALESPPQKVQ